MIDIVGIAKSFGRLRVLRGLDLRIERGTVTAIVGPNASGKTTLIKTILGLIKPDGGRIVFDGVTLNGTWNYRERIGYMPQLARFPDNLSARIDLSSWQPAPVFDWLQQTGNVEQMEMLRTFNCGVGMVLAIAAEQEQQCLGLLASLGENAWVIGDIIARENQAAVIFT